MRSDVRVIGEKVKLNVWEAILVTKYNVSYFVCRISCRVAFVHQRMRRRSTLRSTAAHLGVQRLPNNSLRNLKVCVTFDG